jgi:hypothetical protein
MESIIDTSEAVGREAPGKMILEGEAYTILSLCDDPSWDQDTGTHTANSCSPCPSYTTVPCAC